MALVWCVQPMINQRRKKRKEEEEMSRSDCGDQLSNGRADKGRDLVDLHWIQDAQKDMKQKFVVYNYSFRIYLGRC
jgi:hypothetical protein